MKNYFFADEILYSRNFLKKPNQLFKSRMETNNDERAHGLQKLVVPNCSAKQGPTEKVRFLEVFRLGPVFPVRSQIPRQSPYRTAQSGTKFMHLTDKINTREIIELFIMWQKIWNVFEYLQKHKLIETCDG